MTTTTTRPRCDRCGALPTALVHTGTHPTNCHPFIPPYTPPECPAWCTRDHAADYRLAVEIAEAVGPTTVGGQAVVWQEGWATFHQGPDFGEYFTGEADEEDGQQKVSVAFRSDLEIGGETNVDDPAELRQLAADALAAAEWLEAQR